MGHSAFIKLYCDWPDCYARVETSYTKIGEARTWAAKRGWVSAPGSVDLCGRPEDASADVFSIDSSSWHGHAVDPVHLPITRPYAKGEVKLSCICGWEPEPRWGWERRGVVGRSSIEFRWREHVKETLAEGLPKEITDGKL